MTVNDRFNDNVKTVIEYLEEKHGLEPRKQEVYKGIYPSKLITKIRNIYKNGKKLDDGSILFDDYILDKKMIEELNRLNFSFKKKTNEEIFNYNIELLKEFLDKHNNNWNSIVRSTIYKNFNLGEWVSYLRIIMKHGKKRKNGNIEYIVDNSKRILTKEKINELDKIGFVWNMNSFDINTRKEYLEKRRILHIQLHYILENSKNQIKSKEDIERLNKKLMKILD